MKPTPSDFHRKTVAIGYWAGGLLCLLSLLSLALGISPLISGLKQNLLTTRCPGNEALELKSPGLYTGIGMTQGLSETEMQNMRDIQYSLSDSDGREIQPFVKIPRVQYASDKESGQVPLFQFEAMEKGKYYLNSNYPYNAEGPTIQVILVHNDLNYTRTELIVGIVLFVILACLGLYLIRKSYVASKGAQPKR